MFRLFDLFLFTLERLWQHRVLVLWTLLGLSSATTLALSLVLYVDAVNTGLLASRLTDPPYAYRYRYLGSWEGNITQADVDSATAAVGSSFVDTIGLPTALEVRYARGPAWTMRLNEVTPLPAFSMGALQGADEQMTIVSGEWPPEPRAAYDPIPVLMPESVLYGMGVQVGDLITAQRPGLTPLTVEVAALWRPTNATDPSWIFIPSFFDSVMLVQPDDLWRALEGLERPVEEAAWYIVFDGATVKTSDVNGIITNTTDGLRNVSAVLPGIRMDLSPVDGLNAFNVEVTTLTQQLVIMVLPVGGLVLYFVALVAGLLVSRQQNEDVTLRSRGMSRWAILLLHFLQWLTLAGIALGIGVALCPFVVRLVGQTTSFLRFDGTDAPLTVTFTAQAIGAGAFTGLLAASSGLWLAWRTTSQTITSFRQNAARAGKAWWQRMYLDVLLLIPAAYVLYTLWQQGGLVTQADNPFANPLTFVGPTLFSLGLTLLFLRIWPFLLNSLARIIVFGNGIALLMALRELTRSIGRYRGTLLMMCFTLSLTGYTASMASTIDRSLEDAVNYGIGADAALIVASDTQTEEGETDATTGETTQTVTGYNTLPAEDLLSVDGVQYVSRVGQYAAQLTLPGQRLTGTMLGVDRGSMAAITRFRDDYAAQPLADLLNLLATNRTGILLSATTAAQYSLRINQTVTMQIYALDTWHEANVPIVGMVDYFPTLNPTDGFFAIGNLDPLFEMVGTELPHDIWLSLAPDADRAEVQQGVAALGFPVLEWRDPQVELREAMAAPSRRGVLGFLSVGFVAAITLTLVGTIIQNAASFRAQAMQLGSLRAIGLRGFTVGLYLILLQGIAASSGILSGTSIGVATTLLFLPLLDFSGGLPPYLVRVAWGDITLVYALFAGVLFTVTLATTMILGRERLSTVVKLGDA
ncbi:MAG: ABC transporter permease [Burkholderiales bacterium]|nr:ABC transporter permease [Anaerolineae bacterium]